MTPDSAPTPTGMTLGYARETPGRRPLDAQIDALTAAGINAARVYSDTATHLTSTERPGMTALLDYARTGDIVAVIGIDRLGRTTAEVMSTARTLCERGIGVRSLREGVDTDDPAGAMIVGVLASLSELDDEPSRGRRPSPASTRHASGSSMGRPRALSTDQIALAERMRADGEPVPAIARALGVSRATLYRTLAEKRATR